MLTSYWKYLIGAVFAATGAEVMTAFTAKKSKEDNVGTRI